MAKQRFLAGLVEKWRCREGNSFDIKESVIPSRVNTIVIKFMFSIVLEHQVFASFNWFNHSVYNVCFSFLFRYVMMHPDVNSFDGIRTFRVLRALKTISTVKGKVYHKTIIHIFLLLFIQFVPIKKILLIIEL